MIFVTFSLCLHHFTSYFYSFFQMQSPFFIMFLSFCHCDAITLIVLLVNSFIIAFILFFFTVFQLVTCPHSYTTHLTTKQRMCHPPVAKLACLRTQSHGTLCTSPVVNLQCYSVVVLVPFVCRLAMVCHV